MSRLALDDRTDAHRFPSHVTRLVVLGDPHGDVEALAAVVARERAQGDDARVAFVSVGDNVGYASGRRSSAFCRALQELGALSVYGNHEAWMSEDGTLAIVTNPRLDRRLEPDALAYCKGLPRGLTLTFAAFPTLRIGVRHTIGRGWEFVGPHNAPEVAAGEDLDIAIIGHSHGARVYHVEGGTLTSTARLSLEGTESQEVSFATKGRIVLDAGSLGRPGYHPEPERYDLATYATIDVVARTIGLHALESVGS